MSSTLYHFEIQTGKNKISFKVAKHPSETNHFMIMRVLAYIIHWIPGLRFDGEVCQGSLPAISLKKLTGEYDLWIEIGNPSTSKIKKAISKSKTVIIYGFNNKKNLTLLSKQFSSQGLEVYYLEQKQLNSVAETLNRKNEWVFQIKDLNVRLGNLKTELIRL